MVKEYKYATRNAHKEIPQPEYFTMCHMLGRSEHDALPIEVLDQYWRAKEMGQRANVSHFSGEMLLMILIASGAEHITPETNQVIEYFKNGLIKRYDPIEVKWRGKWTPAQIVQASAAEQTVRIVLQGDAGTRPVPAKDCRLVTKQPEKANEPEHAASNV